MNVMLNMMDVGIFETLKQVYKRRCQASWTNTNYFSFCLWLWYSSSEHGVQEKSLNRAFQFGC